MRKFEKISFEKFKEDIKDDINLYNEYSLPRRATKYSAGYDFFAIEDFTIKPGEIKRIPTGYKVMMNEDEYLALYVRSSMGIKYNVRLTNQVGIIDYDFYYSSSDAHMWVSLQNEGDKDYVVKKGEAYTQGVFNKYLVVDDEEEIETERTGWSLLKNK